MTLAEELMGKRPLVNLSPGRVVSHDDPVDEEFQPDIPRAIALAEWVMTAGKFTSADAAEAVNIRRGNATQYLTNLHRRGIIRRAGTVTGTGGRDRFLWEAVPKGFEAASKRHFGA